MKQLMMEDMEIERNGNKQIVSVDGYIGYFIDRDYGADADGHRGIKKVSIDGIDDLMAHSDTCETINLSPEEKARAEDILIRKFLEGNYER